MDRAGRAILKNKRGYIEHHQPPILERLNLDPEGFIELMKRKDGLSGLSAVGSVASLTHYAELAEKKFIKGLSVCQRLFL